jgi:hypothetical protein
MKKIAIIAAVFVLVLVLTRIANDVPDDPRPGSVFWLKGERIVQCTPTEITLVNGHGVPTHLDTAPDWPDCSNYHSGEYLDFKLSRGEKTHFLSTEPSSWISKNM